MAFKFKAVMALSPIVLVSPIKFKAVQSDGLLSSTWAETYANNSTKSSFFKNNSAFSEFRRHKRIRAKRVHTREPELQALPEKGAICPCLGEKEIPFRRNDKGEMIVRDSFFRETNYTVTRPADYGTYCKAWDYLTEPHCNDQNAPHPGERNNMPQWCNAPWCYVGKDCACGDAKPDSPLRFKMALEDAEFTEAENWDPDKRVWFSYINCETEKMREDRERARKDDSASKAQLTMDRQAKAKKACRGEFTAMDRQTWRSKRDNKKMSSAASSVSLVFSFCFYMVWVALA